MVDLAIHKTRKYLDEVTKKGGHAHFPGLILQGLQVIHIGKGFVRCKFTITDRVLGEDGTLHTAAIAALVELIGSAAVYFIEGNHASVDLNYSLYSTSKIHEEVKIEARVVGKQEDMKSAVIEIRRESDEEIIATGRLWMVPLRLNVKHNGVHQTSKL